MNIKVKAGLEVTGMLVVMLVIIAGIQIIGKYIVDTYGAETALNAAGFCFASVAAYIAVSLMYDIRVAQLKYKEKLVEMTKK
jgi:hypothetical protein